MLYILQNILLNLFYRMPQNSCSVCTLQISQEIKILVVKLIKQLQRFNQEYVPDFRDKMKGLIEQPLGLSRLLSIMLGDQTSSYLQIQKCQHDKLSTYIKEKLKCKSEDLNRLCNEVLHQMARKNYCLENLNTQMKQISNRSIIIVTSKCEQLGYKDGIRKYVQPYQLMKFAPVQTKAQNDRNIKVYLQQNYQRSFYPIHSLTGMFQGLSIHQHYPFLHAQPKIQQQQKIPRH